MAPAPCRSGAGARRRRWRDARTLPPSPAAADDVGSRRAAAHGAVDVPGGTKLACRSTGTRVPGGAMSRDDQTAIESPIQRLLERLHARHAGLRDGQVATYIPELAKADPELVRDLPRDHRRPRLRGRRHAPAVHDPVDLEAVRLRARARGPRARGGARADRRRADRRRVQLDQPGAGHRPAAATR